MDLLSRWAFNLFIFPSQRSVSKNHPCVLTVALFYCSKGRGRKGFWCRLPSSKARNIFTSFESVSASSSWSNLRKSKHFTLKFKSKLMCFFGFFFLQTDRVTQKSHPGDPENALLGGQEEFSGKCISWMEQSYCICMPQLLTVSQCVGGKTWDLVSKVTCWIGYENIYDLTLAYDSLLGLGDLECV